MPKFRDIAFSDSKVQSDFRKEVPRRSRCHVLLTGCGGRLEFGRSRWLIAERHLHDLQHFVSVNQPSFTQAKNARAV